MCFTCQSNVFEEVNNAHGILFLTATFNEAPRASTRPPTPCISDDCLIFSTRCLNIPTVFRNVLESSASYVACMYSWLSRRPAVSRDLCIAPVVTRFRQDIQTDKLLTCRSETSVSKIYCFGYNENDSHP